MAIAMDMAVLAEKDFAALGAAAEVRLVVVVTLTSQAKMLLDLVAAAVDAVAKITTAMETKTEYQARGHPVS